jgi:hypothetical protein
LTTHKQAAILTTQQPSLNERQLTYLKAIYRLDQERERYERGVWNRGQRSRPAKEWRWIAYTTSESLLRFALLSAHLVAEGTGSTFEALDYVESIIKLFPEHYVDGSNPLS